MKIQKIGNSMTRGRRSKPPLSLTKKIILLILISLVVICVVSAVMYIKSAIDVLQSGKRYGVRGVESRKKENNAAAAAAAAAAGGSLSLNDGIMNNAPATITDQDNKEEENDKKSSKPQRIKLTMPQQHGSIQINLRPDLSYESVQHIQALVDASDKPCSSCRFYRSEKDLLLQGVLQKKDGPPPNTVLGPCPPEYQNSNESKKQRKCPSHDPNCGCHGPIMTKGLVAWAGGGPGPDFFINMFHKPVDWWSNDHTVWGEIADEESLQVIERMLELPVTKFGGLNMLDHEVHFEISSG